MPYDMNDYLVLMLHRVENQIMEDARMIIVDDKGRVAREYFNANILVDYLNKLKDTIKP